MMIRLFILTILPALLLLLLPLLPAGVQAMVYGATPDTLTRHEQVSNTDSAATPAPCHQGDVFDLFKKSDLSAPVIPTRKLRAIILPLIASSPGTGLQFGAGSTLSWTIGKNPITKLSAATVQVLYTTQQQLISYIKSNMYLNRNKIFLQTDWRWYLFPIPTYGLGTGPGDNIPDAGGFDTGTAEPVPGGEYPMKYSWLKCHNIISFELWKHIYGGGGYHLDYYYDIHDNLLHLDADKPTITPHYAYSTLHGFDLDEYAISGLSLNFVYDSRDNLINAYKGIYFNLNYRYNFTFMGSSRNSSMLWSEFRTYLGLSKVNPRHLLALWFSGSFMTTGHVPYLGLMSNGFDQMSSAGRGYPQGRWRGEDMVYGEVEYRFPISPCSGVVGGVLFANLVTASNRDMNVPLFGYFKPGAGFGLRIMVSKYDRTNLLIDFGLGEKSMGIYLQAQEIF